MAKAINAEPIFIAKICSNKFHLPSFFSYFLYGYRNIIILIKFNPSFIIIENTTWPIALLNFIYSKISKTKLILDSHSCAFDHTFVKYPLFLSKFFAKYSTLSIVTNNSHYNLLKEKNAKAIILSDIPFEDIFINTQKIKLSEKFNVCYICTFSQDEPYIEVIKAGQMLKDTQIFITGNFASQNINPDSYKPIKFTGYISNEEYRNLIKNADAIMTLTTRENTMQRAGSEAVSAAKPLITSDTKMLKNYFTKGTIFVDNTTNSIVEGIQKLKNNYGLYSSEILQFQEDRKNNFVNKLNKLKEYLELK